MLTAVKCVTFLLGSALAAELKLATFDGAKETMASWRGLNDPVMGGASTSTFKTTANKTGIFNGTCAIVSFLKAPGFAKIQGSAEFADMTGYDNIVLRVKSSTPDYQGFKVAFAAPGIPKTSIYGGASYKATFKLTGVDWQLVEVPLTQFSYDWSGYTGRCDTKDPGSWFAKGKQHYCCNRSGQQPSNPKVCVDHKFLGKINSIEVWAEGVKGDFNIEIDWIGATKTSPKSTPGSLVTLDGAATTTLGDRSMESQEVNVPSLKVPGIANFLSITKPDFPARVPFPVRAPARGATGAQTLPFAPTAYPTAYPTNAPSLQKRPTRAPARYDWFPRHPW